MSNILNKFKAMNIKHLFGIAGLIFVSLFIYSCTDDGDEYINYSYPNALVTVKHVDEESVFLQLDEKTTLFPTNLKAPLFGGKEVRALINFKEVDEPNHGYDKAVHVHWIDSIRTKSMAPDLGDQNDLEYGSDPVEIVKDWVTIAEDGYLTLRFRTLWGYRGTVHHVNLLAGVNPEDPYEVEFRHNAFDDIHGEIRDGLVAFKLDELPDTEGKTVKLKLKWKSFSGDKSAEFDYTTRKATLPESTIKYTPSEIKLQ